MWQREKDRSRDGRERKEEVAYGWKMRKIYRGKKRM